MGQKNRQALDTLHGQAAEVDFESSEAKALMSSWLSKNTGSKFTSAPEMDADTVFAIMSALHFKDSWVDPLDDEDIEVVFYAPEPMPEPVRVVFDRPFAFGVFSHSGAPLFVGAYRGV